MDPRRFDSLVQSLSTAATRRHALAALLAGLVAPLLPGLDAAAKRRTRNRGKGRDGGNGKGEGKTRNRKRNAGRAGKQPPAPTNEAPAGDAAAVSAEAADCLSPGPSSNMNGCNFSGEDFDGIDLSSSSMRNTKFNGASLCDADLSSSQLKNANFRNANLTRADLHSSGCNGIKTNAATTFCQTIMCNGAINDSDCPGGQVCCDTDDCAERECQTAQCQSPACVYSDQPDGAPGILCLAPRQCCDGDCCGETQKCCDGTCIENDDCCPRCPAGETCTNDSCCANALACGDTCLPAPCNVGAGCFECDPDAGECVPTICGPTEACCPKGGPGETNVCKLAPLALCTSDDQCCQGPVVQSVCTDEFSFEKICCGVEGSFCFENFECCSGSCDVDDHECE